MPIKPQAKTATTGSGNRGLWQMTYGQAQGIWQRNRTLLGFLSIALIVLLSFWAGMRPHVPHPYPLHVDEWFSIGYTQSMLEADSLTYSSSYGRGEISYYPEMGFHILIGYLTEYTGLSWLVLYRFAPGVVFALLAFLAYAIGRRDGFGWAAALMVPLIPISIRTLGPTFFVPVSVALLFIPVTLLVLHRLEEKQVGPSLWLLLVLIGGTIFVHPPTEGVVTALAVLYLAALFAEAVIKKQYRSAINLVSAVGIRLLIPVLVLGVWLPTVSRTILERSISGDQGVMEFLGFNYGFFSAFGIIAVAIFIAGAFILMAERRYGLRTYVLPVFTISLLLLLAIIYPRYSLGPSILYERGWIYLALLMTILAGYGISWYFRSLPNVAGWLTSSVSPQRLTMARALLLALGVVVVATAIATSLFNRQREAYAGYYQMVNDEMYADFQWLALHGGNQGRIVMMEPSLGWAYPPLAGPGSVVWATDVYPHKATWTDAFDEAVNSGRFDTGWLRNENIWVAYTCLSSKEGRNRCAPIENTDLSEIRQGVYLVSPSNAKAH